MVAPAELVVKARSGWAARRLLRLFVVSHFWTGTLSAAWVGEAVNAMVNAANPTATAAAVTRLAVGVGGVMAFPPDKAVAIARTVADAPYKDSRGDGVLPGRLLHEFCKKH